MHTNLISDLFLSAVIGKPRSGIQELYDQQVDFGHCSDETGYQSWLFWGLRPIPIYSACVLLIQASQTAPPLAYRLTEKPAHALCIEALEVNEMAEALCVGVHPEYMQAAHYLLCLPKHMPDQQYRAITSVFSAEGGVCVPSLDFLDIPPLPLQESLAPAYIIA